MVEFTVSSMPNLRNVDVDSFFLRFDLKYAYLGTAGLGILLSLIMIIFSGEKLTHECGTYADCLLNGIKDPLPTSQAGFFKFMFVLHIFTLLTEILLLLGGMFKMEGLLAIWLAWPTGFSYIYSAVYSNLAYTDFWELGMKRSNDSALAFTMIGLMLYLIYLIYAWICIYSFSKRVSQS